jgi:hypothetical protein
MFLYSGALGVNVRSRAESVAPQPEPNWLSACPVNYRRSSKPGCEAGEGWSVCPGIAPPVPGRSLSVAELAGQVVICFAAAVQVMNIAIATNWHVAAAHTKT